MLSYRIYKELWAMAIVPIGGTRPKKKKHYQLLLLVLLCASQPISNEEKITKQVFAIRNPSYM